jgi:hypothetical protein
MTGWICGAILIALIVGGCSRDNTPQGVADRFVQAYYVQIDQAAALEFTTALARERLQRELQLVAPIRRGGSVEQARPKVEYSLVRTQPDGRQVLFVYDLTITPTHVSPMAKKVLIITDQFAGQWKVINFTETDAPR